MSDSWSSGVRPVWKKPAPAFGCSSCSCFRLRPRPLSTCTGRSNERLRISAAMPEMFSTVEYLRRRPTDGGGEPLESN
eukprot:1113737-Prymnesium_polylepis.1